MDGQRVLGVCILIAALVLSGAIVLSAWMGRYVPAAASITPSKAIILDRLTGEVEMRAVYETD